MELQNNPLTDLQVVELRESVAGLRNSLLMIENMLTEAERSAGMQNIRQIIIDNVVKDIPLTEIFIGLGGVVDKTDFYKTVLSLIETGSIPNIMVCYCGIDCTRCRTFHATINNDNEMRELIKAYYEEIGSIIEVKNLNCLGCCSDEMLSACAGCPYMKCGKEKGLKRCDECSEYPCESLKWYIEKYIKPSVGKFIMP